MRLSLLPVLLLTVLLGSCFESAKPLYDGATPLRPFRDGAVLVSREDGKTEQTRVREVTPGAYRFISAGDRPDDATAPARFFALPGAPAGTMVSQGRFNDDCTARARCAPMYVYSLWRMQSHRITVINPDCSKVRGVAQLPGVTARDSNCAFTSRASLERAMRMVASAGLKPDSVLTLQP